MVLKYTYGYVSRINMLMVIDMIIVYADRYGYVSRINMFMVSLTRMVRLTRTG
jgi:hypothetical protein